MKFKRHLKYRLFKLIFKNYKKFLQILYKHKLNSNLINCINLIKKVFIKVLIFVPNKKLTSTRIASFKNKN